MRALREIVLASRPLSWVNTAFPFAAAYLVLARSVDARLVVGTLFFLVPYNLLMYGVNDVFDIDSDEQNPRKGGAEGALLSRSRLRLVLWASLLLPVPFVLWLVPQGTGRAALVLAVSLAAVLAYSLPILRFKERPGVDSLTSSTHFASPAVYGLVLADRPVPQDVWFLVAAFFVWGCASHAFGAVQDVRADRAAGIGSVATVLGARPVVVVAIALYVLSAGLVAFGPWPSVFAVPLPLLYAALVARHLGVTDETAESTNVGWRRFLALNFFTGFVVTQLLIVAWRWG